MSTCSNLGGSDGMAVQSFYYPQADRPGIGDENCANDEACDCAQREVQARAEGIREGESRAQAAMEKELAIMRGSVTSALKDFQGEREAYYRRVEGELVQLALAIARKVLHREAQVDPLLLAGIVEIAMRKLETNTAVRLHVDQETAGAWREHFAKHPELRPAPEIFVDTSIAPGMCILETELGFTELGIERQIKEIENGLFDLLAQRPGAKQ